MNSAKSNEESAAIAKLVLLRPEKAAEILGVTEGTLSVWRATKRYPLRYVKIGRHVRYRPDHIEEFIRWRTQSGTRRRRATTAN
jgi:hypothetical protein